MKRVFASKAYPGVFQCLTVAVFVLIVYFSLFGTFHAERNFATVTVWTLWWALLPFSFLLLGRIWCGICPIAALGDLVQRVVKPRRAPGVLLKRYGVWIMALLFLLLAWADRTWGIVGSPRATGILLLLILAGSIATVVLYQRRVWCRYLCPLGALSGIYSMASVLELRANKDTCHTCKTRDCSVGNERAKGCPLFEFPGRMESNRNCNLCGNCVKSCPHDSIELRLRPPGRELQRLKDPLLGEAVLAILMVVIVYIHTVGMTPLYPAYMKWFIEGSAIKSYSLAFTMTFSGVLVIGLGLCLLASLTSGRMTGEGSFNNLASFGYAYIPLALAGHLGHELFELIVEGKEAIQTAIDQLGLPMTLFEIVRKPGDVPATLSVKIPQIAIFTLGAAGSIYIAWRIALRRSSSRGEAGLKFWPHAALLVLLFGVFLHMFVIPMSLRHIH